MTKQIITEAIAAITEAAGSAPVMTDDHMECIDRLADDLGLTMEKVSDSMYVARDLEEDGQKFDYWMFCKYGHKHIGQTVSAIVTK